MLPFEDRYTRQRQLPEVGIDGQQRLQALHVRVPVGPSSMVEAEYLRRAGISIMPNDPEDTASLGVTAAPFVHAEHFHAPGPMSFARGAHRALCRIKEALGIGDAAGSGSGSGGGSFETMPPPKSVHPPPRGPSKTGGS